MKKTIILAAIAALVICSCGTTKQTSNRQSNSGNSSVYSQSTTTPSYNSQLRNSASAGRVTRSRRPDEPCQALAWEKDFAAAGTAISYNEKAATNEAIRDARYELGRMMQVAVEGAAEDYTKNVSVNKKSMAETISEEVNNQFFSECVKNSKVIKTTVYDLSDGTIQVYACVEVKAGFDVLDKAAEVAENILTRDQALEVEFDKEQFKGKVKDGLQQYKESRNQ